MGNQKEIISLRNIAARCIDTNDQNGFNELNRITEDLNNHIFWLPEILTFALIASLSATAAILLPGMGFIIAGVYGGETLALIGLVYLCAAVGVYCYWRYHQYGGLRALKPKEAIYANVNDPAVRNLERLFALLQKESTPRAFYWTKNHVARYVDESYFFGAYRAALVSKNQRSLQKLYITPMGHWFSKELFMEIDVEALIEQAKVKPNHSGAKKTYDYTDAIKSLIEHPDIRALVIGKRGNHTKIRNLLEDWYVTARQTPPSETQLMLYAKDILNVIEKNRRANLKR